MPEFISYDYNQNSMVVINYQDQLQPGAFEHTLLFRIDGKLVLTIFIPNYPNNENVRYASS